MEHTAALVVPTYMFKNYTPRVLNFMLNNLCHNEKLKQGIYQTS